MFSGRFTLAIQLGNDGLTSTSQLRDVFVDLADRFVIPDEVMLDRVITDRDGKPVGEWVVIGSPAAPEPTAPKAEAVTSRERQAAIQWERIAQDPVRVEDVGGTLYAFTTELGALRLAYAFRQSGERAAAGYSAQAASWYFRLEPSR